MEKKEIKTGMLCEAYINYLQQIRKQKPDAFASFTEKKLEDFIRKYEDSNFGSIYECTDHNFYDRVRNKIAQIPEMDAEDKAANLQYSVHLRTFSQFLQSKAFKKLFKKESFKKASPKANKIAPKEREITEGEKKHVEYERAHRSQALRQKCIDKYGFQCQCCGMNFSDLYGKEIGDRFIEVHHLKQIANFDKSRPQDYIENLVPLCSNCHSMIHHIDSKSMTLTLLREAYKGPKQEIEVWKEDSASLYETE